MIHMKPEDPPLLVGFLPSYIELPCLDGTWSVLLTYQTYRHICERRENENPAHLQLVLSRLSTVIAEPSHVGCLSGERHKLDLWLWNPDDFSGVLVSLKCLSGETWVNTSFPLGRKTLRKHVSAHRLMPVGVSEGRKVPAAPCSSTAAAAGSKEMGE
jgi:hypothetical protein